MSIGTGEVHVWLASTEAPGAELDALLRCLSEEELGRARRYRLDADRRRSLVSRAVMRHLVGCYLGTSPESVALIRDRNGKPALADGSLQLNASHSGGWVAISLAVGSPLGVDIEQVRPLADVGAMAERFFSPDEAARVLAAPRAEPAFFAVWTAKEAVVKAVGTGLGVTLSSFTVPPQTEAFTPITYDGGSAEDLHGWCVRAIEAPAGYCAAVAVRGTGWSLEVQRFTWGALR
ncbi:MAG TPA: 4'-phosphopantetheinyl transferase superfamily protein [Acidimicrobiales bacterium]|nr:4'-phosphopantetheinyl transferase superfamily protein [Acidimicrobiales bacterium]